METSIGIKPRKVDEVVKRLCVVLADEFVLYTKTLNAHWNVIGIDFYAKHLFFEIQYKELADIADSVAERIRSLGHYSPATMSEFLSLAHLSERTSQQNDSKGFIKTLLEDHGSIIISIRGYIDELEDELNDAGTLDFLTQLMRTHETMAWKLRAHLDSN